MMEYTIFGESHGPVVGVLLRNVPAGLPVDEDFIRSQLLRRAARGKLATARQEEDVPELLSGVYQGYTTGQPLCMLLRNRDARSGDYAALANKPRPGHADYTAWLKSGGYNDPRGGGSFSGRLTAPLVAAGALVQDWLRRRDIVIRARVMDEETLRQQATAAQTEGDSVGGRIECTVTGLPAGLGGPERQHSLESELARQLFAIPAVKALAFGDGEELARLRGSQANDSFRTDGRRVYTGSNHCGGVLGGISNGMPLRFTLTFKPTPSIALPQQTVDLDTMENCSITVAGRHDPCIALRAAPIVEAAAALALWRLLEPEETELEPLRLQLDETDRQLLALFARRQELSRRIGACKRARGLPVRDAAREAEVLRSRGDLLPEQRDAVERLFATLMELSREVQQ